MADEWDQFADAPASGKADPWAEFGDAPAQPRPAMSKPRPALAPNGGPGISTRIMAALNEGLIADTLGLPVDLANAGMRAIGLPVSDKPFLGSESIRSGMHRIGVGKLDKGYDPRSTGEAYGQSIARGIGQAVIPTAGAIGAGGRLLTSAAPVALRSANPVSQGLRTLAIEAAKRPGVVAAGEAAAGAGAGIGGQFARDTFPGNPYADAAGQIIGGFGGGMVGGMAAARRAAVRERVANGLESGAESAEGEGLNSVASGAPETPARPPVASGSPDLIRFKDAADLANFRKTVHPDKAALSDADFLDWFGRSRNTPATAIVGDGAPVARSDAPRMAMDQEGAPPATIAAKGDEWDEFADAAGAGLNDPALSRRPAPMMERPSAEDMARVAQGVEPGSVVPIPRNEIESLDEAMKANPGARQLVQAPNERDVLPTYQIGGKGPKRKDPLDLVGWLRTQGGIREDRGNLAHLGISNGPRNLDFAKSEGFLGKLVRDDGMTIDDAAVRAWEQGWFPDYDAPPSSAEFLDALDATHKGGSGRVFHPEDYETLDAYNAAQTQRNAVERADQEGRPLVEPVGKPVSMADLDANQPPATAYEDLPRIGGKVGNIRVGKLSSKQDIARALQTVDNRFGGFDAARRGKIAQAETQALAAELNMTPDDLLRRRRGQALNAEQALAARAILAKSGDELVTLAKAAQGGSDEALAAFRAGLVRHAAIQEQVSGATAEAGRALAQFRMTAPGALARGRMLKAIMDSGGGRDKLEDVARRILDLEKEPAKANKFARDIMKPGAWAKFQEYWINALLSGPRTHATNIGSNMLTALWSIPENAMTATIGKFSRSADRMIYRDVGARALGMIEGARDGLRLARKAFVTGEPSDGVSQVEAQNYRAIPGKVGEFIRIPTRALMAEDEFFKSIAYRGELNALAARAAYRREGTPAQRREYFEQFRDNPTDAMIDQAIKAARYQTFQAPLKGPGAQIQMLANKGPMKLFLPFVRTPLNLLKYATERSPMAPVLSEFRDAMRAGGMARDQAIARVSMGSGLGALAVSWALEGKLSGSGPVDPREREALRNTGWQPFSIKAGDRWYSYQRIDPFARVLSTAADFATFGDYMSDEERENIARSLSLAIARNISTMPTLDPAASAFEALSDPDRYLARYAKNLAASATVPNIVTQTNSVIDPYMRETETLMDTIKSRVPVMSRKLPARVNIWGEPVTRGDALGPDLLSPIYSSQMKSDTTLSEVARLRLGLTKPQRKIGDLRMTPDQYTGLVQQSGQPAKAILDQFTASPQWDALPDGMRRVLIRNVTERTRKAAMNDLLRKSPDLLQAKVRERVRRRTGER